jgi:lysophospholipase L1-like esterase
VAGLFAGSLVVFLMFLVGGGQRPVLDATEAGQARPTATADADGSPDRDPEVARSTVPHNGSRAAPRTVERPVPGSTTSRSPEALPGTAAGRGPDEAEEQPRVTFIGDSWTVGVGATGEYGYAMLTADQLGWRYAALGVGGSGYTRPGLTNSTFDDRVDMAVATDPDIIVVQGSVNERRSTPNMIAEAALATLTRLRAEADPDTEILVVGSTYVPGSADTTIDWINDAIEGAALQAGVPFVNPATEGWLDPADPAEWADVHHPNDLGHQLLADRLEQELLAVLVR